ncbi:MAG: carbohydrate-binding domain-containing protein [Anaerolineales bacterium]
MTDLLPQTNNETSQNTTTTSGQTASVVIDKSMNDDYDSEDLEVNDSSTADASIEMQGNQIFVQGNGVIVNGTSATISTAGTYSISGTLDDGQVTIDTLEEEPVTLLLNNANITSLTSAPIYVRNADKVIITLVEDTNNTVTDGTNYVFEVEDKPNIAVFSKDDLTINGTGTLTVAANFNNGIASKDDLKIISGTIVVAADNDGIKGRDSVAIKGSIIIINAFGDGIQSTNDVDADKGNIYIESGDIQISAALDGIQAEKSLFISGGNIAITSGGGSANSAQPSHRQAGWDMQNNAANTGNDISTKGMKAGDALTIDGGIFTIDAADDALHSNDSMQINAGEFQLTSGDDGLHADSMLESYDDTLNITQSYEGIESAQITINGGNIHVIARDDGLNGSDGSGSGAMSGGGRMDGGFGMGNSSLTINGGNIYVDAGGDGLDINGPIEMNDGVVLVNGPTQNMNGALDYTGSFNITSGYLIAVGSIGMVQSPSESSSQLSVLYVFDTIQAAGKMLHIESQSGDEILTFSPTKEYQAVVVSSPQLNNGNTYLVYTGGDSNGIETDGLWTDGIYNTGTEVSSFTISSVVTFAGTASGGFGGRPGTGGTGMGGPGGKPPQGP